MRIEEVQSVDKPPRAGVEDALADNLPADDARAQMARKIDYLDGFLKAERPKPSPGEPDGELYEAVIAALKEIFDPEIPVNIYDLGLIYGVEIDAGHVTVNMTLTTPNCPVAESMPAEVEIRVGAVPGAGVVDVNLVWDPPWSPANMTDEARLELGML
jgi:FeS assembly SUF system protein